MIRFRDQSSYYSTWKGTSNCVTKYCLFIDELCSKILSSSLGTSRQTCQHMAVKQSPFSSTRFFSGCWREWPPRQFTDHCNAPPTSTNARHQASWPQSKACAVRKNASVQSGLRESYATMPRALAKGTLRPQPLQFLYWNPDFSSRWSRRFEELVNEYRREATKMDKEALDDVPEHDSPSRSNQVNS